MEPIFDRAGTAIAWRLRDVLYDTDGKATGFTRQHAVFARDGRYLGRYEEGIYRDTGGAVLAFERGAASGRPPLPIPEAMPLAPRPEIRPDEPVFEAPPAAPMRKWGWSDMGWEDLLGRATARR